MSKRLLDQVVALSQSEKLLATVEKCFERKPVLMRCDPQRTGPDIYIASFGKKNGLTALVCALASTKRSGKATVL
jgi:hypothetical protein